MKKIGIIGFSEGNGHPFSFSSIINGYDDLGLKESGWDVIYNYIKQRDISEIGFQKSRITHVWTQDIKLSQQLAEACKIDYIVEEYIELIGKVDAVIIARDDYENHLEMAKPFLENGLKVFIDKPLTLNAEELYYFKQYILNGQLMSMSGMRYAIELDDLRVNQNEYGELKLIQTSVINDWERYGIHIIDAVMGILSSVPISIEYMKTSSEMYVVQYENGLTWTINILGSVPKTFTINVWGTDKRTTIDINDNFSMFRRTLWRFEQLVFSDNMHYNPADILLSICLLIGGKTSKMEKRKVYLKEFNDILN